MSDNGFQPFAGLVRALGTPTRKKSAAEGAPAADRSRPAPAAPARPAHGSATAPRPFSEEEDETLLFLSAVQAANPLAAQPVAKRSAKKQAHSGAGAGADAVPGASPASAVSPPATAPSTTARSDALPSAGLAIPAPSLAGKHGYAARNEAAFGHPVLKPAPAQPKAVPPPPAPAPAKAAAAPVDEEHLFSKAMQGVQPVAARGREVARPPVKGAGAALQADPNLLADLLLGKLEFALHHTDEYIEGFVVGIDPLVLGRLRAGHYSPEAHIDLHGYNSAQAQDNLMIFVKNAYYRNMRTLLIITGRGKNSPNGMGVLRADLQEWLTKEPFKRVVLAFCTAQASDGGPGAVYVLLRKFKKGRGKIRWERRPSSDDFV